MKNSIWKQPPRILGSLKGKYAITSNYPLNFHAMLLKLANSQDIGFGYYTDTLELNLEVDWPDEATVKIIKKIREATRSLQVPFTASMQMKPARNLSKNAGNKCKRGIRSKDHQNTGYRLPS